MHYIIYAIINHMLAWNCPSSLAVFLYAPAWPFSGHCFTANLTNHGLFLVFQALTRSSPIDYAWCIELDDCKSDLNCEKRDIHRTLLHFVAVLQNSLDIQKLRHIPRIYIAAGIVPWYPRCQQHDRTGFVVISGLAGKYDELHGIISGLNNYYSCECCKTHDIWRCHRVVSLMASLVFYRVEIVSGICYNVESCYC